MSSTRHHVQCSKTSIITDTIYHSELFLEAMDATDLSPFRVMHRHRTRQVRCHLKERRASNIHQQSYRAAERPSSQLSNSAHTEVTWKADHDVELGKSCDVLRTQVRSSRRPELYVSSMTALYEEQRLRFDSARSRI